jgi:hypothetical protein
MRPLRPKPRDASLPHPSVFTTFSPAKACTTGMISIVLTLKCAGSPTTQRTVSATSSEVSGVVFA